MIHILISILIILAIVVVGLMLVGLIFVYWLGGKILKDKE